MNNKLIFEKHEKLLSLHGNETAAAAKKLSAFTERVRGDIARNLISEVEGQRLIAKATIIVSMLTTT